MDVMISVQITGPNSRENLSKIIDLPFTPFTPWEGMKIEYELKLDSLKLDIIENLKERKLKFVRNEKPLLCLEMNKLELSKEYEYDAIVEYCIKEDGWTVTK